MQVDVVAAPISVQGGEAVQADAANRGAAQKAQDQTTAAAAASPDPTSGGEAQASGTKVLASAVDQIDRMLQTFDDAVRVRIDHHDGSAGSPHILLYNSRTGQVIREIPQRKIMDLLANFKEQIAGLFVDQDL